MTAALDPLNTRSHHQASHHFVADSPWSDLKIPDKAWQWVDSCIPTSEQRYLIIDDTGIPEKGSHSVGVSHQNYGCDHTRKTLRDEQWLLVVWPEDELKPTRY